MLWNFFGIHAGNTPVPIPGSRHTATPLMASGIAGTSRISTLEAYWMVSVVMRTTLPPKPSERIFEQMEAVVTTISSSVGEGRRMFG